MTPPTETRRWLMPGGRTVAQRRPKLARDYSAPAVMQRLERAVHDTYESLPVAHPKPSLMRRVSLRAQAWANEREDHAEATVLRVLIRSAWWWVRCCWRRR